jgi:undecaprenyl-diphosphatase
MGADPALPAIADALGRHALSWFFAGLFAAVALAGGGGRWLLGHTRLADRARIAPGAGLALRLTAGFGVIVAAAALFATIAGELGDGETLVAIDAAVSRSVGQQASPATLQAFAWLTHFGDTATLTVLGISLGLALALRGERGLALAWVVAIAGNSLLNVTLKGIFERVRPVRDHAMAAAEGWSFPSGHSSGSVVAYGMLAYIAIRMLPRAWHVPAVMAAAAIAFTTGCSRIFLQVHYPTDVVAGFATGSAWLAACIASAEATRHYRRSRR